jgi:hypothetical protein
MSQFSHKKKAKQLETKKKGLKGKINFPFFCQKTPPRPVLFW